MNGNSNGLIQEPIGQVGDWTSVGLVLGTLGDLLPPIAALLSVIWILIRIAETEMFAYAWERVFGLRPPWNKGKSND